MNVTDRRTDTGRQQSYAIKTTSKTFMKFYVVVWNNSWTYQ